MQDEQGGVVSDDGLRVAGIYQTWEGACDPDRAYSTYRWCSDFRREGYVKDHTFQLWVSADEQSLQLMDATPSTQATGSVSWTIPDCPLDGQSRLKCPWHLQQ